MSTVITEDAELTNSAGIADTDDTPSFDHPPLSTAIRPDALYVQPSVNPVESTATQSTNFIVTPTITVACPVGEDHQDVVVDENSIEASETVLDVNVQAQIEVPTHRDPDTSYGAMDEMSPTTEEYQECCAPDDFQLEGEILAPGCVAPAPTPAPSIAPLAEFEGDPADDDAEPNACETTAFDELCEDERRVDAAVPIEPIVVIQTVATVVAPKRLHRKKRSADGTGVATGKEGSVSRQTSEEVAGHNSVCPWEDE